MRVPLQVDEVWFQSIPHMSSSKVDRLATGHEMANDIIQIDPIILFFKTQVKESC